MKIVILDRQTLGEDLDISGAEAMGEVSVYDQTEPEKVAERLRDAEVLFVNKVKLGKENLASAKNLKIICEAATGFDNIDIGYCQSRGIAVCNVPGYSVYSVAQVTVSMVLSLVNHLPAYTRLTSDGTYTKNGAPNILTPVYHELYGKTWGIVGYGAIGHRVGEIAKALGCELLAYKRNPVSGVNCVDLDTLLHKSDIVSVHIPLSAETRGLIGREALAKMKKTAVLVNTARGAVLDEEAVCEAIEKGNLSAFGSDVYSHEPFSEDSPYYRIKGYENVCLTPHMAWGAAEARSRCFSVMLENLQAFIRGEIKNRVDLG